jgi:hypothetical protein
MKNKLILLLLLLPLALRAETNYFQGGVVLKSNLTVGSSSFIGGDLFTIGNINANGGAGYVDAKFLKSGNGDLNLSAESDGDFIILGGILLGDISSATNASPNIATNGSAPDGYLLSKTGDRLKLIAPPTGGDGGSATNAVSLIKTNNTDLDGPVTNLNFFAGANISLLGSSNVNKGDVKIVIGATGLATTAQLENYQLGDADLTNWAGIAPANKQDALGFAPQLGSANLTNWSALATASKQDALGFIPQLGSANLTNWSAIATASKQDALGFSPQLGSANLTNWSSFAPSVFGQLAGTNTWSGPSNTVSGLLYLTGIPSGTGPFLALSNNVVVQTNSPGGGTGMQNPADADLDMNGIYSVRNVPFIKGNSSRLDLTAGSYGVSNRNGISLTNEAGIGYYANYVNSGHWFYGPVHFDSTVNFLGSLNADTATYNTLIVSNFAIDNIASQYLKTDANSNIVGTLDGGLWTNLPLLLQTNNAGNGYALFYTNGVVAWTNLPASSIGATVVTNNGTLGAVVLIGNGVRGATTNTTGTAVPINADGSASTFAQISTVFPALTNGDTRGASLPLAALKTNSAGAGYALFFTNGVVAWTNLPASSGAQTPWASDINAAGKSLTNVHNLEVTNALNIATLNATNLVIPGKSNGVAWIQSDSTVVATNSGVSLGILSTNGAGAGYALFYTNGVAAWTNLPASGVAGTGSSNLTDSGYSVIVRSNMVFTNAALSQLVIGATSATGGTNHIEVVGLGGSKIFRLGTNGSLYVNGSGVTNIAASQLSTNGTGSITVGYLPTVQLDGSVQWSNPPAGGAGTVTTVSVANANGFGGSVANPTTTPAITILVSNIVPRSVIVTNDAVADAPGLVTISNGIVTATTFIGALSGNATTATAATHATNFWGTIVQSNLTLATITNNTSGNATTATTATSATAAIHATNFWGIIAQSNLTLATITNNTSGNAATATAAIAATHATNFWGVIAQSNLTLATITNNTSGNAGTATTASTANAGDDASGFFPQSLTTNSTILTSVVLVGNGVRGAITNSTGTAVPINADGSASTFAQISTVFPALTNGDTRGASLPLAALQTNNAGVGYVLTFTNGIVAWTNSAAGVGGGVSSVSVTTSNGVVGSVADPTTTPALSFTLTQITPNAVTVTNAGVADNGFVTLTNGSITLSNAGTPQLMIGTNSIEATSSFEVWNPQGTRILDLETNGTITLSNIVSTTISNTVSATYKHLSYTTNLAGGAVTPDWNIDYSAYATNGQVNVGLPINGTAKLVDTAVILLYHTGAAAYTNIIAPAGGVKTQGTWYVTNCTSLTVMKYGNVLTNMMAIPLY